MIDRIDELIVRLPRDDSLRSGLLRVIMEDIAEEFTILMEETREDFYEPKPKQEFVVELKPNFPPLQDACGPYYVIFGGDEDSSCRKPILAVSEKKEYDVKCAVSFSRAYYFIKMCPFVLDYVTEYAKACKIDTIRHKKEY